MGYARYRPKLREGTTEINLPTGFTAHTDATSNLLVNFTITYEWTSSTNCKISEIAWKPGKIVLNSENVREIVDESFTANSPFITAGKVEVKIGGSTPENFPIDDKSAAACTLNDLNLNYSVNQQYLLCDFTYSNVIDAINNDVNEEYSQIEYYIEIKNIKIPKTTKYEHNVVFTQDGLTEFITNIKKYPIVGIEEITNSTTWNNYTEGKPCLKVTYGDTTRVFSGYKKADGTDQTQTTTGFQYVPVGSNITFPNETLPLPNDQATGTIRITINGVIHEIPVYGLSGTGSGGINLNGNTTVAGHLLPSKNAATTPAEWNIGATDKKWHTIYALNGNFTNLTVNGTDVTSFIPSSNGTKGQFWRGGGSDNPSWSNELIGPMIITSASGPSNNNQPTNAAPTSTAGADFRCTGAGYFGLNLTAAKVFNAVFNDYAEYRSTINLAPGHVVIDQDDGSLICSFQRLQPGAQIISDTFGHSMGYTKNTQTPLAVAGRVLVYTYRPREEYHAGMAVCSAPNGTVDIMTREEIRDYPDCIIGIVSEIPQYKTWGSDNVNVDGRIWIKVK